MHLRRRFHQEVTAIFIFFRRRSLYFRMQSMKHTILSGSSRKNSTSLLVSRALERVLLEHGADDVEVVSFEEYDLPFFNGDLDINNLTPFQHRLITAMR